ncbi:primase-helicase family protein [Bradyrhizobium sp. CCBAU 11361]|uniref:primase-helicase family protein n=1 Tax=Bradyrhizobium sp. CCBAU 11361 TaxID=1630812 RepID=UPI002306654F|nr:primase-helicase family protein [Bradyrhizobium sp. CCBAU 11361]
MMPTEITVFEKVGGPLTKRIALREGKIASDSSACRMARGFARRATIRDVQSLADLIASMKSNEAYAIGSLRDGLPERVRVVRKDELDGAKDPTVIARTLDYLTFRAGNPGLALLDFDTKGMPAATRRRIEELGGDVRRALEEVIPGFSGAACVERASTSSGLLHRITGQRFPGSGGRHIVVPVVDAADIPRFLSDLYERCWLAGFGWGIVSAAGSFLDRAIIDKAVGSPERLVFEGSPIVEPPLEQMEREVVAHGGASLDTRLCCPPLSEYERAKGSELRAIEELRLLPERREARARWSARHIARLTAMGYLESEARAQVDHWVDRKELGSTFPLLFDDPDLAGATVGEVLAKPDQFISKTLSDPFEGPDYGRGKAILYRREDGSMFISSFAHGGCRYELIELRREDFVAYMPMHKYIFLPTRELWPASSVNARLAPVKTSSSGRPVSANKWLDQNRPVEQMTWAPGEPALLEGHLISEGGWIPRAGCTILNLYRPPTLDRGNPCGARRWLDHIRRVYPGDADHILHWLAHRVQRPQEKINHALVLGGAQGIGKDTLIEPVKRAVGPWNLHEVSPKQMLGRFNGFLKSVILRISEARDLGEIDRFAFYDHMKAVTAAPPDVLRIDEKNVREYSVPNVCGVLITTNHKTDGIYLSADDRRHYVAWSDLVKEDFSAEYWTELWRWYDDGGDRDVAAWLASIDLTAFNPKAPPPKTEAFWAIVDASRAPEDAELADVLDRLGNPDAVTLVQVQAMASDGFEIWLGDRKNRRQIPHRFEQCGYVVVRNNTRDGLWVINRRRQVIYARANLPLRDRLAAATKMTGASASRQDCTPVHQA